MGAFWKIPREWDGETAVVIGGGPSLTEEQVESARRFRMVACNDAGITVAKDADVLCWADGKWYSWHRDEIHLHTGKYKIIWRAMPKLDHKLGVKQLKWRKPPPFLSTNPSLLTSNNTGVCGINIAFLFGVKRILLIGFDMQQRDGKNNWHDRHQRKTAEHRYRNVFIPEFRAMARQFKRKGIEVINCSPGSAMKDFPMGRIEDIA